MLHLVDDKASRQNGHNRPVITSSALKVKCSPALACPLRTDEKHRFSEIHQTTLINSQSQPLHSLQFNALCFSPRASLDRVLSLIRHDSLHFYLQSFLFHALSRLNNTFLLGAHDGDDAGAFLASALSSPSGCSSSHSRTTPLLRISAWRIGSGTRNLDRARHTEVDGGRCRQFRV